MSDATCPRALCCGMACSAPAHQQRAACSQSRAPGQRGTVSFRRPVLLIVLEEDVPHIFSVYSFYYYYFNERRTDPLTTSSSSFPFTAHLHATACSTHTRVCVLVCVSLFFLTCMGFNGRAGDWRERKRERENERVSE